MAANTSPIFVKNRGVGTPAQIVNADGTTKKTIYTAGAEGGRLFAANISTDDTAAEVIGLFVQKGGSGTVYPIGSKSVAARSGDPTNASPVASVNLLDPASIPSLDTDGSLPLGAGDVVQVAAQAAITAAKTTTVVALVGDF